ncbi:MAG: aldehyde dehydrogenase family protein [Hyphomicrobium sp.]|jgi:hypothetical protein
MWRRQIFTYLPTSPAQELLPQIPFTAQTWTRTFKPALIEASGNDPFIVMPSAPVDIAARGVAFASFLNAGQVCTSAERICAIQAERICAIQNGFTALDACKAEGTYPATEVRGFGLA